MAFALAIYFPWFEYVLTPWTDDGGAVKAYHEISSFLVMLVLNQLFFVPGLP